MWFEFIYLRHRTRFFLCVLTHDINVYHTFYAWFKISWQNSTGNGVTISGRTCRLRPNEVYILGHILALAYWKLHYRGPHSYARSKLTIYGIFFNLECFFFIWKCFFSIWFYLRRAVKNRETKLNESSSSGKKNGNVWINEGWCLQLTNLAGRNWSRTRVMTAAAAVCLTAWLPGQSGGTIGPRAAPWQVDAVDV